MVTDSLSARALAAAGYDVPRAVVAALGAGADLALFGGDPRVTAHAVSAVAAAVASGALPRSRLLSAAGRVLAAKGVDLCRVPGIDAGSGQP